MQVSELMSREPVTVSPDQTIGDAASLMARSNFGFLPVGENDQLIGMITDRDIALRGAGAGKGPETPIREAMTQDVCYCFEDEEVESVARNLGGQKIRRIPVVSRDKRLVGVVSLGDIAVRGNDHDAGAALEQIAQPGGIHA